MQLIILLLLVLCLTSFLYIEADDYAEGAWRKSLDGEGACWTDRSCQRVLTTAHGGEWNISFPYDSMPAFNQAYLDGADAIKGGKSDSTSIFYYHYFYFILFLFYFIFIFIFSKFPHPYLFLFTRFSCCKR